MAKTKPYFPPNYVDANEYAANLERELAGYRNRAAELTVMGVGEDEGAFIDATSGEQAVLAELKRLGFGEKPKPKPAEKPKVEAVAKPAAPRKPARRKRTRSSGAARPAAEAERPAAKPQEKK